MNVNDGVTWSDAERHQGHQQCIGAAAATDAVSRPHPCGEALLEHRNFGAKDVLAVIEHALDVGVDGLLEFPVLRFEVDERYGHLENPW
jgi:hypothetical protein